MEFTKEYSSLIESLMALIRSSTQLSALDVGFVRSLSPELARRSEDASSELLDLINALIAKSSSQTGQEPTRELHSAQDVVNNWRSIEQSFDLLMDKIDSPPKGEPRQVVASAKEYMSLKNAIAKPQLKFRTKVDNSLRPFKPLLTSKPFAQLDLKNSLLVRPADDEHEYEWYEQPYLTEIQSAEFPESFEDYEFPSWENTPFTYVDTPEELFKMVSKLESAAAVAVDVEHHDYRSYLGIVCLLQLSAGGEDYVVDAIALRSELQVLNKVFANPRIVKVLHGAKMDINWLQRDLGVYIVNLFDTFFAAHALEFPKHSLAYLLQRFAQFEAKKEFQLADWRVRPLPQELLDYARADTHFLLFVYSQIRKMLDAAQLTYVVEESRKVAASRYEMPGWNEKEPQWHYFVLKHRLSTHLQRCVAIRLLEWRDDVARKHDESPRFVMAPLLIVNLCHTRPSTGDGVLSAAQSVSKIVRENAHAIAEVIQRTQREEALLDTNVPKRTRQRPLPEVPSTLPTPPLDDKLKCAHSAFIGDSQPAQPFKKPNVFLGVFDAKDLEHLEAGLDAPRGTLQNAKETGKGAEIEAQETRETRETRDPQEETEETQETQETQKERGASTNGRKFNLVEQVEDIDLSTKIEPSKKTRKVSNEPAFDFGSADRVMGEQKEDQSFSQFGKFPTGPKGAHKNTSKFKKGRSFRN